MSDPKKNVYLALAAVGWADGNLDADEADAIAKLALEDGLDLEEVDAVERSIRTPVTIADVDLSNLAAEDRHFVYAVAAWLATLDGELADGENETLDAIAAKLGLDAETTHDLEILVRQVAYESGSDRPFDYDLGKLRDKAATVAKA
ncbi:MAG: DUF533 domain-containing protein [Sandaracinus sp.]|nr:DUF533 domain-containing protein [Sandaracinus sp.]MCB9620411.1 DUF533 domain-containing protein [Sandaracinus sp.]